MLGFFAHELYSKSIYLFMLIILNIIFFTLLLKYYPNEETIIQGFLGIKEWSISGILIIIFITLMVINIFSF